MNLYDVLAWQGTTHFERLFSQRFAGGGKPQTLTGIPPLSFKADGSPLISWSMKGNGSQQGTPTPDAPIMPTFCGVRTANLVDIATFQDGMHLDTTTGLPTPYGVDRIATMQPIDVSQYSNVKLTFSEATQSALFMYSLFNGDTLIRRVANKNSGETIDTSGATKMYLSLYPCTVSDVTYIMLNAGSSALPYEPFGWKIPISCGGTTSTIYLTEQLRKIGDYADTINSDGTVTRRIYRFKVTQASSIANFSNGFTVDVPKGAAIQTIMSNIAVSTDSLPVYADRGGKVFMNAAKVYIGFGATPDFPIVDPSNNPKPSEIAVFNEFVSTHDVYVWYALETPETEHTTFPTITPTKGSNTLSVDTTVQPSEMTITFKG